MGMVLEMIEQATCDSCGSGNGTVRIKLTSQKREIVVCEECEQLLEAGIKRHLEIKANDKPLES